MRRSAPYSERHYSMTRTQTDLPLPEPEEENVFVNKPLVPKVPGEFRVLVTGSRTWDDIETLDAMLETVLVYARSQGLKLVVIHGAHRPKKEEVSEGTWEHPLRSVDWLTHLWCINSGVKEDPHPAKWTSGGQYNSEAGKDRNVFMVKERNADICISAMRGVTSGTAHCTRMAKKEGIPIVPITQDTAGGDFPG